PIRIEMGFGKCVHSILAASLIFLSSTNVVAAVLPEYARLLSKPLVERKALPITFGLENELGCRLLHAVEVCALGIVATQFPALLPGTLAVLAQHPRHASWLSSRLTYRRLEKTVRQLGDPNLELDFRSFRYGP